MYLRNRARLRRKSVSASIMALLASCRKRSFSMNFSEGSRCAGLLREDSSDSKPGTCGV